MQELQKLNLPADQPAPGQIDQLQGLQIPSVDNIAAQPIGSSAGASESEAAQLAQLELPKE